MPTRREETFGAPVANYQLEIDGVDMGAFLQIEGIPADDDWETPKVLRPGSIVLKRGSQHSSSLSAWRTAFLKGLEGRKSGSITALTMGGQAIAKWSFYEGWPCKILGPAANMDGKGGDICVNEVELSVEKIERC